MIYFDNSSTTYKKPKCVIKAVKKALTKYSANPGRGSHNLSLIASDKVLDTRINLANYFNLPNFENVIFTSGCTESLNLAILGSAKKNGHIVTTMLEHNSVLRTITQLTKTHNITYTLVNPNKEGIINPYDIEKAITPKTYLIIVNHTSNVIGSTQDINKIGEIAKKHKVLFLVDGAQSIGHEQIDMQKDNINLLCGTAHKGLYGPQGVGFLLINNKSISPIKFGGTGTNSASIIQPTGNPESLESGTGPTPNIIGLNAGLEFVCKRFNKINLKIKKLSFKILNYLNSEPKIKVYTTNTKSGVIGFEVKDLDSSEVVNLLNNVYGICVRGGLQCAPKVHEFLGTTKQGLVRISVSYFNTMHEVNYLIKSIKNLLKMYLN